MSSRTVTALALLLLGGCAPALEGPEVLLIQPDRYADAFLAAEEAARDEGLDPALRDRRGGVIETEPGRAPSLLEPWAWTGQSGRELTAATANHARRRARFEFTLPGGASRPVVELPTPDLLGESGPATDLTTVDAPLELRVWVSVERRYDPGVRRGSWSRALTSRAVLEAGNGAREDGSGPFWVPAARDRYTEQRLLASVARALDAEPADSDAQ